MGRIRQFMFLGGWAMLVQIALVVFILTRVILFIPNRTTQVVVLSTIVLGFFSPYPFRTLLLGNMSIMRHVLNTVALAVIVYAFLILPRVQPPWNQIAAAIPFIISAQVGAWFWMLSDPRLAHAADPAVQTDANSTPNEDDLPLDDEEDSPPESEQYPASR